MKILYWQNIGRTLSINPGQIEANLSAVIFDGYEPEKTLIHTLYKHENNFS